MDRVLKEKKKELEKQVNEIYPLEKEPRRPFDFKEGAKTQLERESAEYMEAIYHYLESVGGSHTISELKANFQELEDVSVQRVSAILRIMTGAGALKREEIQRKAYFELA